MVHLRSSLVRLTVLGLLATTFALSALPAQAATVSFTSTGVTPTNRPWLGFGSNEYPVLRDSTNTDIAWTSSALNLTESRLSYMRPGLTRINWYRDWFNPSGTVGTYDWTTLEATATFQILDYYKAQGYPVQIGMWHTDVNRSDPATDFTSPDFASVEADLMNELINVKGYTNIRYYASINEPDCIRLTFPEWETETHNLTAAFQTRGLATDLIVGPDDCRDKSWLTQAAQNDSSLISAYGYHSYQGSVSNGSTETGIAGVVNNVDGIDSANKPVYISEMGMGNPDTNSNITTYGYGLDMIDYGTQAARAGAASAMAWCLDGFDGNKNCGMWDISGQHSATTAQRPWFYTWSLLNRYFPAGWTVGTMPEPSNMRIMAAYGPNGGATAHWSFSLVNRDTTNDQTITLQVPGWGSGSFNEYLYSQANSPTDANGFPVPVSTLATASGGLAQGVTVTVPANSAVVLTTLDGAPIASTGSSATGSITDTLSDWSKSYSHTSNWRFDSSSATAYFNGDATRITRTSNTPENVVYHLTTGIVGFDAKVYYYQTASNRVSFFTSPDGTTWTPYTATMGAGVATTGSWYHADYTQSSPIPTGTTYLKVQFANDGNIWTPQLAQIIVTAPGFATSFESGQPQPTWINTPADTVGVLNVSGFCCGLTGPEANVNTGESHTGTTGLVYSGIDNSTSSSYAYLKVFDLSTQHIVVDANTQLGYWIYPQSSAFSGTITGANSTCVAIDLVFTDGTYLRDLGATDQHGNNLHPHSQCGHLALDAWNQVQSTIGAVANGKTISQILIGYDQSANTGGYRGFVDDISLNG